MIYIVDGYGLIFRSYFAHVRRPLINSKGKNTSAIFGFFQSLKYYYSSYKPTHILIALDSSGPTFRNEIFPDYKATRDKTAEDLISQFEPIFSLLDAMNIPRANAKGYEADDVIASTIQQCNTHEFRIISSDKDLFQLVDERVKMLRPSFSSKTLTEVNTEWIQKEKGIAPSQVLDYLTLLGDTSDNIPGVPKVGEVTAAKLLKKHKNIAGIYDHLSELTPALQKNFEASRAQIQLSKRLIQLAYDIDLPYDDKSIEEFTSCSALQWDKGLSLLQEYELFSLIPQKFKKTPIDTATDTALDTRLSTTTQSASSPPTGQPATPPARKGAKEETKKIKRQEQNGITIFTASTIDSAPTPVPTHQTPTDSSTKHAFLSKDLGAVFTKDADRGTYTLVRSLAQLTTILNNAATQGHIAIDLETEGLNPYADAISGIALASTPHEAYYLPLLYPPPPHSQNETSLADLSIDSEDVRRALANFIKEHPECTWILHNAKFDLAFLRQSWNLSFPAKIFDTMIGFWMILPIENNFSLDTIALRYLGYEMRPYKHLTDADGTPPLSFSSVPLQQALDYAAEDADITLRLYTQITGLLTQYKLGEIFYDIEMPLTKLLCLVELEGICLNKEKLTALSTRFGHDLEVLKTEIYSHAGYEFNINSTKQLQTLLFETLGLPSHKKTKTGYSTDVSVLTFLANLHPIPQLILAHRHLSKLKSTYTDTLPGQINPITKRLHTSFQQTGTETGRISSINPNLQNIPIKDKEGILIREAFFAPKNRVFVSADYSQIELAVLAHLSKDPQLLEAFKNNLDIHIRTASLLFGIDETTVTAGQRRIAKSINFGIMYGMSAFRLSNEVGIPRAEAQDFITRYFEQFVGVRGFIDKTIKDVQDLGYSRTIIGRRRPILHINSENKVLRSTAERIAVNTTIQGSAADIMKLAMLSLSNRLKELQKKENLHVQIILQIHDELVLECPDHVSDQVADLLTTTMTAAYDLAIPLRVHCSTAHTWGQLK